MKIFKLGLRNHVVAKYYFPDEISKLLAQGKKSFMENLSDLEKGSISHNDLDKVYLGWDNSIIESEGYITAKSFELFFETEHINLSSGGSRFKAFPALKVHETNPVTKKIKGKGGVKVYYFNDKFTKLLRNRSEAGPPFLLVSGYSVADRSFFRFLSTESGLESWMHSTAKKLKSFIQEIFSSFDYIKQLKLVVSTRNFDVTKVDPKVAEASEIFKSYFSKGTWRKEKGFVLYKYHPSGDTMIVSSKGDNLLLRDYLGYFSHFELQLFPYEGSTVTVNKNDEYYCVLLVASSSNSYYSKKSYFLLTEDLKFTPTTLTDHNLKNPYHSNLNKAQKTLVKSFLNLLEDFGELYRLGILDADLIG